MIFNIEVVRKLFFQFFGVTISTLNRFEGGAVCQLAFFGTLEIILQFLCELRCDLFALLQDGSFGF